MVEATHPQVDRNAIKQELLDRANNYFATFEQYALVLEVPERNYIAR